MSPRRTVSFLAFSFVQRNTSQPTVVFGLSVGPGIPASRGPPAEGLRAYTGRQHCHGSRYKVLFSVSVYSSRLLQRPSARFLVVSSCLSTSRNFVKHSSALFGIFCMLRCRQRNGVENKTPSNDKRQSCFRLGFTQVKSVQSITR